ncbi:hypothetical protein ACOJQI_12290 [Bacillus salacetis]|uniref:hypothetical protein n=1 Tax=Bacillus salacetis TaxID=2315464 RepID=UPI003BA15EF8
MKRPLFYFGLMLTVIFGGGFLIRLIRDGDFYIAEFGVGVLGLLLLVVSLFIGKSQSNVSG